jgi:PAS domain S-box-containing protein
MSAQPKTIKPKKYRSLSVTLAIAFIVLSATVLLISGGLNLYYVFQNQQKTVVAQQELIAQNAANSVKNFVQGNFHRLESAVRLGGLASASPSERKTILEKLLGLGPAFRQILLLDPQDRELLKVSRQSDLASSHFAQLVGGNKELPLMRRSTFVSSIFIDEVSSEPLMWMWLPITDIFGDSKGILAAEVNLKFMWELVGTIRVGKSGQAYVVDKKGDLLAFHDISRVLKGENLSQLKEVSDFENDNEVHVTCDADISRGIQGGYVVSNHVPLGVPDWAVVVELPVHEAYQTLIHTFVILGLAMILSLCLTILIGIFLSKRIMQPIVAFRDATKKIGAGDLNTRIKIESRNEIGELAHSFNTMVDDLNMTTVSRDALEKEVAERTQAEKALKESEERFKAIFEGSSDAVMLLTDKGFFDCNPATLEMFGFSKKEEFTHVHPADISPPTQPDGTESFPAAMERIKTAFEKGSNRFEWVHRRTSGEDFFAEVLLTAFDLNGKRVLQATVRDITQRKQAELALLQSEAAIRGIYMAAPVGIAVSSKRTMITINRRISEISGYTEEELVGHGARIFFVDDAEYERAGRELYGNLKQRGRANVEARWKRKDGVHIDVLLSVVPIENTDHEVVTVMDITERNRTGEALRQSEQRFRVLFDQAADVILQLEITPEGIPVIREANNATFRLLGFERDELIGQPVSFINVVPDDSSVVNIRQQNVLSGTGAVFEARHRCKDGTIRDFECSATEMHVDSKIFGMTVERDITRRKQAELALQESEEKYRALIETTETGFLILDSQGRVLDANREYVRLSGHGELREILGRSVVEWTAEHSKQKNAEAVALCVKDGMIRNLVIEYVNKSGKTIPVEINATVNAEGGKMRIISLCRDITERKKAERALAESEKSFRSMFELTSEGVSLISPKTGKFIAANPAMCAMFGYTEEEFCTLSGEDITPPEAKEIMRQSMKDLFNGGNVPDHEGICQRKGGAIVNAIVSCRQMSWKGEPVFLVTFKDVTPLKAVQAQLKKKNAEILEFTNMVTHDLKKPLTTMNIVFGMARKGAFGPLTPDGAEAADTGLEASKYMQEMLADLLACAKFEAGTQELVIEKTGFRELAAEVVGRLKFQVEEKKISVSLPDGDVSVMADRKQLTRVLMNLVGNAINYIGKGPDKFIRIAWEQKNDAPVFLVADNGIGVPEASRKDLFGKFKRGSNVSGVQGTGLGLSIVKGIVEAHGGKIWFESETGKGTTFYFTLTGKEANS